MSHLENAISEADKIESQLNVYCDSIQHIQKSIVNMGKKNTTIQVMGKNNHVLLGELENIIVRIQTLSFIRFIIPLTNFSLNSTFRINYKWHSSRLILTHLVV
jgi:Exocyst complex component Sec3